MKIPVNQSFLKFPLDKLEFSPDYFCFKIVPSYEKKRLFEFHEFFNQNFFEDNFFEFHHKKRKKKHENSIKKKIIIEYLNFSQANA